MLQKEILYALLGHTGQIIVASDAVDGEGTFEGASLTDLVKFDSSDGARQLAEHIECACSGVMACSTCHVVVDPIWYEAVGAADEDEEDMLDLAHDPRRTSRLGCQVKLTPALDGMVVWVPHGANNMMDDIPEWSTDR